MNYIKQVNYYWQQHEVFSLTGNECALYMYLLKRSNSSNWRNPIEVMNSVAIEFLNLKSFREIQCSRDRLLQAGLIQFRTVNGSKVVTYSLFDAEAQTFAPIAKVLTKVTAKVLTKVTAKVSDEVGGSVLIRDLKPKPKPETKTEYRRPRDFLKSVNETGLEQMQMKSHLGDEFEKCIEQWDLAIQGGDFAYCGDDALDCRKLTALLQKWVNTWVSNNSKEKSSGKKENGSAEIKHEHGSIKVDIDL